MEIKCSCASFNQVFKMEAFSERGKRERERKIFLRGKGTARKRMLVVEKEKDRK